MHPKPGVLGGHRLFGSWCWLQGFQLDPGYTQGLIQPWKTLRNWDKSSRQRKAQAFPSGFSGSPSANAFWSGWNGMALLSGVKIERRSGHCSRSQKDLTNEQKQDARETGQARTHVWEGGTQSWVSRQEKEDFPFQCDWGPFKSLTILSWE